MYIALCLLLFVKWSGWARIDIEVGSSLKLDLLCSAYNLLLGKLVNFLFSFLIYKTELVVVFTSGLLGGLNKIISTMHLA